MTAPALTDTEPTATASCGERAAMVRLAHVTKRYGATVALDDVSLVIGPGEFMFLVGPSGSGKSTLLRLLRRDELPSAGRVEIAGRDVTALGRREIPHLRRRVGTIFQDFKLLSDHTVAENVTFALAAVGRRGSAPREVPAVLDLVGLADKADRFPHELSGGEQQRVAIARALVNHPKLLLADEPTGNLDPATAVGIVRLLDRVNRTGVTVVTATHDAQIVDLMRQRVIELSGGRVVRDEPGAGYRTGRLLDE